MDSSSRLEPSAWKSKYFKHASCSWFQLDVLIIGKKEIMFNSKASHTNTQWLANSASKVLKNKVVENKLKKG